MTKPDIPKRLAARIRSAQVKLEDACRNTAGSESNAKQDMDELAAYYADPEAYARARYPGHGVDSYPVKTRISRIEEKVAYNSTRGEVRKKRIEDAVAEIERVEAEVLAEVSGMRPTTGRVPWPKAIPAAEDILANHRKDFANMVQQALRDKVIREAEWAEEDRLEDERVRKQQEIDDEQTRAMLREMTPEQQAEWWAAIEAIVEDLRSKKVGLHNIDEYIKSGGWKR